MQIAVVGVDHHSCPVNVRERLALDSQAQTAALAKLRGVAGIDETLILSTCARTEVYLAGDSGLDSPVSAVKEYLAKLSSDASEYLTDRRGQEAVKHAFRVASGLESQIVGEDEVAGQVRAAVALARDHNTLGPELSELFRAAMACSRRVRRETRQGEANVAAATVALAAQYRPAQQSSVLVIGSGRVAHLLARSFANARSLTLASRTTAGLKAVADTLGARVLDLDKAIRDVSTFDIVCTATRSRRPILREADISSARELVVFDLGVPRNVDPDVRSCSGVTLRNVDDIRVDVSGLEQRVLIDSIVESELHDFVSRQALQGVGPIIQALRAHVERVRDQEISRITPQLAHLDSAERTAVEQLVQRLMDRMFHHLVIRLKLAALTDFDLIRAAEFFFVHEDGFFPQQAEEEIQHLTSAPAS